MSSEVLHEDANKLGPEVIDQHRAIVSLMEELEAVDWHNRDEEKEHAAMVLEWLRRGDPKLSQHLKTYLYTEEPVTEIEAEATGEAGGSEGGSPASSDGSLGIGSLRPAQGRGSK